MVVFGRGLAVMIDSDCVPFVPRRVLWLTAVLRRHVGCVFSIIIIVMVSNTKFLLSGGTTAGCVCFGRQMVLSMASLYFCTS